MEKADDAAWFVSSWTSWCLSSPCIWSRASLRSTLLEELTRTFPDQLRCNSLAKISIQNPGRLTKAHNTISSSPLGCYQVRPLTPPWTPIYVKRNLVYGCQPLIKKNLWLRTSRTDRKKGVLKEGCHQEILDPGGWFDGPDFFLPPPLADADIYILNPALHRRQSPRPRYKVSLKFSD